MMGAGAKEGRGDEAIPLLYAPSDPYWKASADRKREIDAARRREMAAAAAASSSSTVNTIMRPPTLVLPPRLPPPPPPARHMTPIIPAANAASHIADVRKLLDAINDSEEHDEAAAGNLDAANATPNPPPGLLVTLLRHQQLGVVWLQGQEMGNDACGILADDMGLGKTVQAIALMVTNKPESEISAPNPAASSGKEPVRGKSNSEKKSGIREDEDNDDFANITEKMSKISLDKELIDLPRTTLIVAPLGLIKQWEDEILTKTAPGLFKVLLYHGKRPKDASALKDYDVVITTYSTLTTEYPDDLADTKRKGKSKAGKSANDDVDKKEAVRGPLFRSRFFRVILDEAQCIKNHKSRSARACCAIETGRRICLTGTPLQNNVEDMYSLFKFLRVKPFDDFRYFQTTISKPLEQKRDPKRALNRLRLVLKAVMLRRTKTMLIDGKPLLDLPPRTVNLEKLEFGTDERAFYDNLKTNINSVVKSHVQNGTGNVTNLLALLLRLRQACDHPYLIGSVQALEKVISEAAAKGDGDDGDVDEMASMMGSLILSSSSTSSVAAADEKCGVCQQPVGRSRQCNCERITFRGHCLPSSAVADGATTVRKNDAILAALKSEWVSSAKVGKVMELLRCSNEGDASGDKWIVFSQFTTMLDILEVAFDNEKINFVRYDGSMSNKAREASLARFRNDAAVTVALISLMCGSVGLNLTCANRVILVDIWWNPMVESQAIDRVHRIGQKKDVCVHRLTIADTVEDNVLTMQEKKRALIEGALGDSGFRRQKLGYEDLLELFEDR